MYFLSLLFFLQVSILVSHSYRESGKIPRAILEVKNTLYLNCRGDEDMIDQANWELVMSSTLSPQFTYMIFHAFTCIHLHL